MSDEYTPTTDDLRDSWREFGRARFGRRSERRAEGFAEFDRWLAAHDREVAAKAWGEGLHVAYNHVGRLEDAEAAGQGVTIPDPVNPYRAALGVPVSPESEGKK